MMQDDHDDDYNAHGTTSKAKKPTSSSKKPVSSSSTGAKAPLSGNGALKSAGTTNDKGKGKDTKRAKVEEVEEMPPAPLEKRARAARAGSNGKKMVEHVEEEEEEEVVEEPVEEEEEDDGITRCVCDEDNEDLSSGLMIECDTCKCWQHGPCVGLWNEKDCPDRYYCELCRPNWHGPGGVLRKAHRKGAATAAPVHRRSPSIPSAQARNKPRESADAALVSAFLTDAKAPGRERDSQSPTPPPPKKEEPAKKRSTMNSRDAAYDDAIALSILGPGSAAMRARLEKSKGGGSGASGSAASGDEEEEDGGGKTKARRSRTGESPGCEDGPGDGSVSSSKRRRLSVDAGDQEAEQMDVDEPEETLEDARREYEANEARRQAEAEAEALAAGLELLPPLPTNHSTRAKHPNQYTYRPKGPGPSRGRASPVKRSTKDSTSAKGDTAYNGGGGGAGPSVAGPAFLGGVVENLIRSQRPRDWTPLESGGWGMPDHLKHLAHLLPSPMPKPLVVPAPTTYSLNAQGVEQYYEQPTRVRFPNKRMTMPEMKKRARNVLDYLGKVQVEMSERQQRSRMLEVAAAAAAAGRSVAEGMAEEQQGSTSGGARGKAKAKARAEEEKRKEAEKPALEESETVKAMEALTRELHSFQQKFWGED